jgi:D-3-phosphoglycerate dehydrogenase / 2-oxoglutarate reductase
MTRPPSKSSKPTPVRIKRVVRMDLWVNPVFGERLAKEPDIELQMGALKGGDGEILKLLQRAHVYSISAARNELPKQWWAGEALLKQCPELLCISSGGAGYDTVDVAACTRAGVAVVNQIGGNAQSVAELAFGLTLAVARKIVVSDQKLRRTSGFSRETLMGMELSGKTFGIVGIGNAGSCAATIAKGFGMAVLAYDPLLSSDEVRRHGAEPVPFTDLLKRADVVSVHCPLDDSTRNLFDAKAFAAMKQGAIFVTTARGGIHDERALYEALTSGHLSGAGLDVWDVEPPPLDNPLLTLDNVVATFHTAGVTHEARYNVAAWGAEQIVQVLRGERPPRLVNPEVWPVFEKRYAEAFW